MKRLTLFLLLGMLLCGCARANIRKNAYDEVLLWNPTKASEDGKKIDGEKLGCFTYRSIEDHAGPGRFVRRKNRTGRTPVIIVAESGWSSYCRLTCEDVLEIYNSMPEWLEKPKAKITQIQLLVCDGLSKGWYREIQNNGSSDLRIFVYSYEMTDNDGANRILIEERIYGTLLQSYINSLSEERLTELCAEYRELTGYDDKQLSQDAAAEFVLRYYDAQGKSDYKF